MNISNANDPVYTETDFVDIQENLIPHAEIHASHTIAAWFLLVGTSLGVLALILVQFLTFNFKLEDWVETIPIAPFAVASIWWLFFISGLVKSLIGRQASRDAGDSFRFDLFVASLKVSVAGTIYCTVWLLFLCMFRFRFNNRVSVMLPLLKLASTHFIFAGLFRSKLETCLANLIVGSTYVTAGLLLYYGDLPDLFGHVNLALAVSASCLSLLCLWSGRWIISVSMFLLSSSFFLGAFAQSRYAIAVSFLGAMAILLIDSLGFFGEGLAALVAMLFGSWTKSSSSSSSNLGSLPIAEAEPLLTARSEHFIVIKN